METSKFTLSINASISEAVKKIEENHSGFVIIISDENFVSGVATDGDIRRGLLRGLKLGSRISECQNTSFEFATIDTPREMIMKQLDLKIKFIPLLDENKHLIDVITRNNFPLMQEGEIIVQARAPVRVSFAGGGSDTIQFYSQYDGAVLSTTISLFAHASMKLRDDQLIKITSAELESSLEVEKIEDLPNSGLFGLITSLIKVVMPTFGFELHLHSDFPIGSGLGGSSAICAAILGCFNQFRNDPWKNNEIAEIAFQAERLHFGVAGGWQDQYATVFGGLNYIEFSYGGNQVTPLRLNRSTTLELEERLILCDTRITHDSGSIHEDQKKNLGQNNTINFIKENVQIAQEMKSQILAGKIDKFGTMLDDAWRLKQKYSGLISTPWINEIYDAAVEKGALGGKLLGAGGGGYFIFYVPDFKKIEFLSFLKDEGLSPIPFRFEPNGLEVWKKRQ